MKRVLLIVLVGMSSCGLEQRVPARRMCPDGWPVKLLLDKECPRGVCGWSCVPGRWDEAL